VQAVSGVTAREWTGIPSWVRRITISIADISLSSGRPAIRIGTSAGFLTTSSYFWDCWRGDSWVGGGGFRDALRLAHGPSSSDLSGHITLTNHQDNNAWIASFIGVIPNIGPYFNGGAGYINLGAGPLDRVQFLQLDGGATTFSSGSVSVLYE
jgi:hypothetical protein